MVYGYLIVLCLSMVLLGYSFGRRIGHKEGFEKGKSEIPLSLKMDYYQTSHCPICSRDQREGKVFR